MKQAQRKTCPQNHPCCEKKWTQTSEFSPNHQIIREKKKKFTMKSRNLFPDAVSKMASQLKHSLVLSSVNGSFVTLSLSSVLSVQPWQGPLYRRTRAEHKFGSKFFQTRTLAIYLTAVLAEENLLVSAEVIRHTGETEALE